MDEELKVGDCITVIQRLDKTPQLHKVEKITKSMYICSNMRFRKNFSIVGADKWGPFKGRKTTYEDLMYLRCMKAKKLLNEMQVTEGNIVAVESLLNQYSKQV